MPTTISRDPSSRTELVREVTENKGSCDWCGNHRRNPKGKILGLFRYGTEPDGLNTRVNWASGTFCSIGCCRTYHS